MIVKLSCIFYGEYIGNTICIMILKYYIYIHSSSTMVLYEYDRRRKNLVKV
jgi:hypothetical protein